MQRLYKHIDEADDLSCRPDFSILIYPAFLATNAYGRPAEPGGDAWGNASKLAPEMHVTHDNPPTIVVQASDDPFHFESGLTFYLALKSAGAIPSPCELAVCGPGANTYRGGSRKASALLVFANGGHGYGMCPLGNRGDVCDWPSRVSAWLRDAGLISLH